MSGMSFESRTEARRKAFKKGVDGDDARRKREDEALSLRKAKKDEQMQKKRMMSAVVEDENDQENVQGNSMAPAKPYVKQGLAALRAQLEAPATTAEERLAIVTDIRKRLSKPVDPPTQEACDAGIIPTVVQYLSSEDTKLQFEAAWVITNIASGDSNQTAAVVHAGAVPGLAGLLASPLFETREQAAWAIGNILGDSPELRNHALQYNLLPAMLGLIVLAEQSGPEKVTALRNATWALSNVFRGKPGPELQIVAPALPYLAQLLHHADGEVKSDTLWAMSYLCDGENTKIDAFCQMGSLPHCIQHLGHEDTKIVQPALRVVGNVATGADAHTEAVVQGGALHFIEGLMAKTKTCVRKEAMWLVSNVTAGTRSQIQAVIDVGLIPTVVQAVMTDVTDVKKEALWVLANAAIGGSAEQLEAMAHQGAVTAMTSVLDSTHDNGVLTAVLDGLKAFLTAGQSMEAAGRANIMTHFVEEADGLTKLESLQEDASNEVYTKAVAIVETFFEGEDNDENEGEMTPAGSFDFA